MLRTLVSAYTPPMPFAKLAEGDTVVIGKVQAQTEDEPRRRGLF